MLPHRPPGHYYFMKQYYFSISVSYQSYLNHYSGAAANVLVITECGLRLQLPATRFRPFLTHSGIYGRFCLEVNEDNKFLNLYKI